jgi:hypothetical protein
VGRADVVDAPELSRHLAVLEDLKLLRIGPDDVVQFLVVGQVVFETEEERVVRPVGRGVGLGHRAEAERPIGAALSGRAWRT